MATNIVPSEDFTLEVRTVLSVSGTVSSVNVSGGTTGLTFSGGPITTSGTITMAGTLGVANGGTGTTTAFTQGSVIFAGAAGVYSQDNSNFFWDNTNKRVGIGAAGAPTFRLHVIDTASVQAARFEGNNTTGVVFGILGADRGWAFCQGGTTAPAGGFGIRDQFNNLTRLVIDGAGLVGINSPGSAMSSILNVYRNSLYNAENAGIALKTAEGAGNVALYLNTDLTNLISSISSVNPSTGTRPLAINPLGGNVGISTPTPGSALDVKGVIRLSGATSGFVGLSPQAAAGGTTYTLPAADGSAGQYLQTNGSALLSWQTPGGGGNVTAAGASAGQVAYFTGATAVSGSNNHFWDNANGRLGIGTGSPGALLHVSNATGNQLSRWSGYGTNPGYVQFDNTGGVLTMGLESSVGGGLMTGGLAYAGVLQSVGAKALQFGTSNAARLTIDSIGNVGIGTTSPASLLAVGSSLSGYQLVVAGTGATSPALTVTTKAVQNVFYPEAFGAKPDALFNNGGNITAASAVLTLTGSGSSFSAGDVGKTICVVGAGAAGVVLKTTILSYTSPTQVTLNATATTSVVVASVAWGTDSTSAFSTMFSNSTTATLGCTRYQLQAGAYLITDELAVGGGNSAIFGAGKNATEIFFMPTAANKALFRLTAVGGVYVIRDMMLQGPYAGTPSYGISSTVALYYESHFADLFFDGFDVSIRLSGGAGSVITQNITSFENGTYGIAVLTSNAGLTVRGGLIFAYARPYSLNVSNGSATVTAGSPTFYQAQIGMRIWIQAAGVAGADLVGTITAVASTTSATMSVSASTTATKSAYIGANTSAGIYIENGSAYISDIDVVGGAKGIWLNAPNGASASSIFLTQVTLDSVWGDGCLAITPTGSGASNVIKASNCWFASANSSGFGGVGALCGVYVNSPGNSSVKDLSFTNCIIGNNSKHGAYINGATNVQFSGCNFDGNSGLTTNTYNALYLATCLNAQVNGSMFSHSAMTPGTTDAYSIRADVTVTGLLNITGNMFRDFGTAATPILDSTAIGGTGKVITNNVY